MLITIASAALMLPFAIGLSIIMYQGWRNDTCDRDDLFVGASILLFILGVFLSLFG